MKWDSYLEKIGGFLFSGIGGAVNAVAAVASSVISVVATILIGIIFLYIF